MPEASVRRGPQVLSGVIGRKESCRWSKKFLLKDRGLTSGKVRILLDLNILKGDRNRTRSSEMR